VSIVRAVPTGSPAEPFVSTPAGPASHLAAKARRASSAGAPREAVSPPEAAPPVPVPDVCRVVRSGGPAALRVREMLDRVGDKWSLYVVARLGEGTKRFTELQRESNGISHRVLTVTLRTLERDGIVTRTVYPVVPPRVDYALTEMGTSLLVAVEPLLDWAAGHAEHIDRAREAFDGSRG
jgi:DNA-binding HxlR family transcriptional regulator